MSGGRGSYKEVEIWGRAVNDGPTGRRKPIVPLSRTHVQRGLRAGLLIAIVWTIIDIAQNGVTWRTILLDIGYAAVMVVAMVWESWQTDRQMERDLRASRRADGAHALAKVR